MLSEATKVLWSTIDASKVITSLRAYEPSSLEARYGQGESQTLAAYFTGSKPASSSCNNVLDTLGAIISLNRQIILVQESSSYLYLTLKHTNGVDHNLELCHGLSPTYAIS
jgi:hypothetical protein